MEVIIGLVSIVAGAVMLWLSMTRLKLARTIEDIPTSKIDSAHQGLVEIKGKATLNGQMPLLVPRLQVPCVWFRYQVFREHNDPDNFSEEKDKESNRIIYMEDATGICAVHAHLADIHPKKYVQHVEMGATHRMYWIGVGETIYALGWLNTLHPAPRVHDVIAKETTEKPELRYGQLKKPLATLTKHPVGQYPFLIGADFEHKIINKFRTSSFKWLAASFLVAFFGSTMIVVSSVAK